MRIIELCFSTGRGGLELYAAQASQQLAQNGHEVLCVGSRDSLFSRRCGANRYLAPPWRILVTIRRFIWLNRAVSRFRPDVIHLHCRRDFPIAALTRWIAGEQTLRLVYHRHTAPVEKIQNDRYHRFLYAQVDCYIAITEGMAQRVKRNLPLPFERVTTLFHGVGHRPDRTAVEYAAETLPANEFALRVGCFARINERKGQHVLVEAVARLASRGTHVQAMLFGVLQDPEYFQTLETKIAALQLQDHVHYHGFVNNSQAYMACCDIVVHTGLEEPFGLVIAEAMASGAPVIATRSGGVPEIICRDDLGLLYPPGDAEQLAECIQQLAENPERRQRLAHNGQTLAMNRFSAANHFRRLEMLLAGPFDNRAADQTEY